MGKAEMLSDIDFLDVTARPETLNNVPGQPVQIQLGTVPSYALTIHKTQAAFTYAHLCSLCAIVCCIACRFTC